jgi:hypothetical protein
MNDKITRKIEERITRELLLTANDKGWGCVGFDYGDGFTRETQYEELVDTCLNVDDIFLVFQSPDQNRRAWVRLVFGNDGWDLINDYSMTEGFEESVMQHMDDFVETIEQKMFA